MGTLRTKILSAREAAESYRGQIRSFTFQTMPRTNDENQTVPRISQSALLPLARQIHPVVYRVENDSPGESR